MEIKKNYSLKELNSFGIDAKATDFISINNTEEIQKLVHFLKHYSKKHFVIGSGSNLLFTKDFDGCIITYKNDAIEIIKEEQNHIWIKVAAGIEWDDFVAYCVKKSWFGIENLSFIPGKVGSSAVQNIGAYGVEVKDFIDEVEAFDLNTAEKRSFSNKDCKFDYRYSIFKEKAKNNYLITAVNFKLNTNFKANITYTALENYLSEKNRYTPSCEDIRNAVIDIRQSKLPDHKTIGNAGSFFKNPIVSVEKQEKLKEKYPDIISYKVNDNQYKLAAGWLIDKAGWKGKSLGEIGVHHQQALVIVNHGKASGKEIYDFSEKIKKDVFNTFNVLLTREVIVL